MDINNVNNLIFKLSSVSDDQIVDIDLSFHLVRKQSESDYLYQSYILQVCER